MPTSKPKTETQAKPANVAVVPDQKEDPNGISSFTLGELADPDSFRNLTFAQGIELDGVLATIRNNLIDASAGLPQAKAAAKPEAKEEKTSNGVSRKPSALQKKVWDAIEEKTSKKDVAKKVKASLGSTLTALKALRARGLAKMHGTGRGATWKRTNKAWPEAK